jgi:hypothetical protein
LCRLHGKVACSDLYHIGYNEINVINLLYCILDRKGISVNESLGVALALLLVKRANHGMWPVGLANPY